MLSAGGERNMQIDETFLVRQAREGDSEAFFQLVSLHDSRVLRLARYLTKSDADAEGVLQGTFLQAYDRLDQIDGQLSFRKLVTEIAVSQASLIQSQSETQKRLPLSEAIHGVDGSSAKDLRHWDQTMELPRQEIEKILESAIQNLELNARKVFVLRDIEDLSIEDASRIVGLTVAAFKSSLLRARLRLREELSRLLRQYAEMILAGTKYLDFAVPRSM
jgi:RNA polymerase sigma-70 factor (ECF subfamily)